MGPELDIFWIVGLKKQNSQSLRRLSHEGKSKAALYLNPRILCITYYIQYVAYM